MYDDCRVAKKIKKNLEYEPQSLAYWAKCCDVESKPKVFDIGAYTGLFSIVAAAYGCTVDAFEPVQENMSRLLDNARFNNVNINIHRHAVWDRTAKTTMRHGKLKFTSGSRLDSNGNLPVDCIRIDDLLKPVDLIKLDIEGFEAWALIGGRETIARHWPTIIAECLDGAAERAVKAALIGYRMANKLDGRNRLFLPC